MASVSISVIMFVMYNVMYGDSSSPCWGPWLVSIFLSSCLLCIMLCMVTVPHTAAGHGQRPGAGGDPRSSNHRPHAARRAGGAGGGERGRLHLHLQPHPGDRLNSWAGCSKRG